MAPFKQIRTYQKTQRNLTKSESAFNDLLAKNLSKRFECCLDRSAESTFDRLLESKCYNAVTLKNFPENKFTEDTSSVEVSNISNNEHCELKSIHKIKKDSSKNASALIRSPILTRSRSSRNCTVQSNMSMKGENMHSNSSTNNTSRENSILTAEVSSSKSTEIQNKSHSITANVNNSNSWKILTRSPIITRKKSSTRTLAKSSIENITISSENSNLSLINDSVSIDNSLPCHMNTSAEAGFKGFSSMEQNDSFEKIHHNYLRCSLEMMNKFIEPFSLSHKEDLEKRNNRSKENIIKDTGHDNNKNGEIIETSVQKQNKRKYKKIQYNRSDQLELETSVALNHRTSQARSQVNLTEDSSSLLEYSQMMPKLKYVKPQLLIASTPLQSRKKPSFKPTFTSTCLQSTIEDKENCSPIKKSYETINLWNYQRPSPNSFTVQKNVSIDSKSKNIIRKKRWRKRNKLTERMFQKEPRVLLERIPQLDKILRTTNRSSIDMPRLLLEIDGNKNLSAEKSKGITKKYKNRRDSLSRKPVVVLTPLKLCANIRQTKENERKKLDMGHVCTRQCECFKKQPKVILNKLDCSRHNGSNRKPQGLISIIDISDAEMPGLKESQISIKSISSVEGRSSDHYLENSVDVIELESSASIHRSQNECETSLSNKDEKELKNDCYVLINKNTKSTNQDSISENKPREDSHCSSAIKGSMRNCYHEVDSSKSIERIDDCIDSTTKCEHYDQDLNPRLKENCSKCTIIESSITLPMNLFRRTTKYVSLAPGKKYRRSRSIWKIAIESFDNSEEILAKDKQELVRLSRRISVKLLPVSGTRNPVSELERYASINTGNGYVSSQESSLGDLENEFQNLFTSVNASSPAVHGPVINFSARDIVLRKCGQTEPLNFEKCYPSSILQNCQKIGEGVFGEVFMFREKDGSTTVMKIIPIEGDQMVNLEKQKSFEEIISEIVISTELSNLRFTKRNNTNSFTEVKKVRCVEGCYPDRLMHLWELYDENKKSENDSPEIFGQNQRYIILELSNGGCDLEAFEFCNGQQSLAVFKQIAGALAVAENELQFEHRDLHWGNVLVIPTREKESIFILDGKEMIINNKGVKATIIDFTLSRIEHKGVIIFNDLAMDEELFTAKGDYQFEIYRLMQKHNGNIWQNFKPYTNILWLHYLLDKAISNFRYKNIKSKIHREAIGILKLYKNDILQYESVSEFVLNNLMN